MNQRSAGFTLMEAIVALGVFALVVMAAQRGFASGTRAIRAANEEARAVTLARSLLASAGADAPLADGTEADGSQGKLSWVTRVRAYRPPDDTAFTPAASLYWVEADVNWRSHALAPLQTVHLTTMKRGAMP